jgi:hypothetical protein
VEAARQVVEVLETFEKQAFEECSKAKKQGQEAAFFGGDTVGLVDVALDRQPPSMAPRHRGHLRREGPHRSQDAGPGGVGSEVPSVRRRQGGDTGCREASGVQHGEAGSPRVAVALAVRTI